MSIIEDLKTGMLFRRLSAEQLQRIANSVERVELEERQHLFEQGDPARRFYLVMVGQVKLFRLSAGGDEKVIEVINPGSAFAEALMFMEAPVYPVCAQALKDSSLLAINAGEFVKMLRESVDTCLLLAADLSQRLHGLLREINDLSLNNGTCRVASYLLQYASESRDELDLHVPKQVLASRLSIKPETLSRIFRSLTNAGLVAIDGNHVKILDRMHLSHLARVCSSTENTLLSTFHYPPVETGSA